MNKLYMPDIFGNKMVLQRGEPVRIWGSAQANTEVVVTLWKEDALIEQNVQMSKEDGTFSCELKAQDAGIGFTLCVESEGEKLSFEEVAFGEVWIAGGQSNMEYFLRYEAHWQETKKLPKTNLIRMYNVKRQAFAGQERDFSDSNYWFEEGDYAFESFSAPGYHFARILVEELQVPVGIIGCNWGGTPTAAWVSEEYAKKEPMNVRVKEYEDSVAEWTPEAMKEHCEKYWLQDDDPKRCFAWRSVMYGLSLEDQESWMELYKDALLLPMGPYHHYRPSGLYHTMIESFAPYSVKGVIWYQGESDADKAELYADMMEMVISCWRETFANPALPFYMVQLAPFGYWLGHYPDGYPTVRKQQEICADRVPNTHLISIGDIGMYEDIHPKEKREVGIRLGLKALSNTYGVPVACDAPRFVEAKREGQEITLFFDSVYEGLCLKGSLAELEALEIWENGVKKPITSFSIGKNLVKLSVEITQELPVEIRFAETFYYQVNLVNSIGLPVFPFTCRV